MKPVLPSACIRQAVMSTRSSPRRAARLASSNDVKRRSIKRIMSYDLG